MNEVETKKYLMTKPEALEDFPFGPNSAVFKVSGKLFAILGFREESFQLNLKCDPHEALALRDIFPAVIPGYHMNKKHWNTVILNGSVPNGELCRMIDRSYALVVKSLKKAERRTLEIKYGEDVLYL